MRAFHDIRVGFARGVGDGSDFRVGIGGEAVNGNDRRYAKLLHVLDMLFEIGDAFLNSADVFDTQIVARHTTMHLERADGGDDDGGIGFEPALRHFMSKNFSAPRSAPKPASVTT